MITEVCCSRAAWISQRKSHRAIDPLCIENPAPKGRNLH